jgi:hypothetical protein
MNRQASACCVDFLARPRSKEEIYPNGVSRNSCLQGVGIPREAASGFFMTTELLLEVPIMLTEYSALYYLFGAALVQPVIILICPGFSSYDRGESIGVCMSSI